MTLRWVSSIRHVARSILPSSPKSSPIDLCTNAQEFDQLPQFVEHADPFDRMVIAQAMAEGYTLVSPDTRFPLYEPHGLKLLWE
jgi:PIN domain nuclease of toxin-antitoxin system